MAQFVLKIEKLSHIMGPRGSQDLRSPSPITAPDMTEYGPPRAAEVLLVFSEIWTSVKILSNVKMLC